MTQMQLTDPGRVTQRHPAPGTLEEYVALRDAGELIDLGGRPLVLRPCDGCNGAHQTVGETCPLTLACPTCQRPAGRRCQRPSQHQLSAAFTGTVGAWCAGRINAASVRDDERERAGDPSVPAPWPMELGR